MKHDILSLLADMSYPFLRFHEGFVFIIATPQAQGSVMTDPLDVINKFRLYIGFKCRRQFIDSACKHKVLPYQKPQFVAGVIKPIFRIISTTPYTDTIVVCGLCLGKELIGSLCIASCQDVILRNVICSHSKDLYAVDHMSKFFSPLILLAANRHSAKADALLPDIQHILLLKEFHFYGIKGLCSKSIRPPKLWL